MCQNATLSYTLHRVQVVVHGKIQSSEHPLMSTASVGQVAEKISHEAFGNRPVKILNSKNLPIAIYLTSEGTKGNKMLFHI